MNSDNSDLVKLLGELSWIHGPVEDIIGSPVKRGILHAAELKLVLDCEVSGYKYDIVLVSTDGIQFQGRFFCRHGHEIYPVDAQATMYSNPEGYFLFGKWVEKEGEYLWWAQLRCVERFPDEE